MVLTRKLKYELQDILSHVAFAKSCIEHSPEPDEIEKANKTLTIAMKAINLFIIHS